MFHFHKMSKWSIVEKGKVVDRHNTKVITGTYLTQERFCLKCDKIEIKTVATTYLCYSINQLIPESKKLNVKHDQTT